MFCLHKTTSAVSCVKPNASQWEATLRDDVGFATVYRRIYRCKFFTLSNQTSRYIRECIRIFICTNSSFMAPNWVGYIGLKFESHFRVSAWVLSTLILLNPDNTLPSWQKLTDLDWHFKFVLFFLRRLEISCELSDSRSKSSYFFFWKNISVVLSWGCEFDKILW